MNEWITVDEAAQIAGVSRPAIYNRVRRGQIDSKRDGGARLIRRDSVVPRIKPGFLPEYSGVPKQMSIDRAIYERISLLRRADESYSATLDRVISFYEEFFNGS